MLVVVNVFVENVLKYIGSDLVMWIESDGLMVIIVVFDGSSVLVVWLVFLLKGIDVFGLVIVVVLFCVWGSSFILLGKMVWVIIGLEN